ncbi:MAG: threonine synthase, partial [Calditrichaeota bacterium]|nr:threonine synthase [Calditrichota bacterium]
TYNPDRLWNLCPVCDKPLLAEYDLERAAANLNRPDSQNKPGNIWRYHELLPVRNRTYQLTLGEGGTPLLEAKRLATELGLKHLYIKDEGNNPTGSFKARGLCVAVSRAWELGASALSIPSAGNAGGAMSAYAALAGLPAFVYLPQDVPVSFVMECRAFGASVNLVNGLIGDCGRASLEDSKMYGRFDLSTLKEPYRLEGKKTMGYEIAEYFNWQLPDVIIYPTGGGTGFIGMWKAFDELEKLGWINSHRPRMISVQAEGCAPVVRAFQEGVSEVRFWENAKTIADGLRVPSAIGDFLILEIMRKSDGRALSVSDEDMMNGAKVLGKKLGIFASPESGATVAALEKLLENRLIDPEERVVLFNTGSGYKYGHLWQ